ncbi:MAG: alpha/beta hydrolase [Sphingobacteriales bacterium]|jgi:pimeloyl-ACP methyl ester carboxylesterase|nr:MAG: alpha/beta hydrolase [Sphingobacteriales bacterium]
MTALQKINVYFISGLGADKRVFKYIQLPDGYNAVYLDWIKPQSNETLAAYAQRMAAGINTTQPFVMLGLSMGGMIAAEIARLYPPQQLILISSVPHHNHLPYYFKWAGKLRLQKIVPLSFIKSAAKTKRLFTNEKNEDKQLMRQLIDETDNYFLRWAMSAIVSWRSPALPEGYIHIHGDRDEILPHRFVKPTHTIKKGSHLMILTRARAINEILTRVLPAEC